ncbi:hypothetical protein J4Q44_G00051180 [Coregonus suidteri]|uniref:Sm domain-containing protein n=1 Tax=Coregonus suidteri TaxID=861788 RepID=A0AAN8R533_9TELE
MTDGRTLVGLFLCTDRDCNVILGSAQEFLKSSDSFSQGEPRVLGLAMIPGHHVVSIEEEATGEPTAPSAPESWTTVGESRKCSIKRKQMSPVSPLIRMEATEESALGGNRFSCFASGESEEKSAGNPGSAEETLLSLSGGSSTDSSGLAPSGVPAPTLTEEERVFPTPIFVDSPPPGDHRFPDRPPNEELYLK